METRCSRTWLSWALDRPFVHYVANQPTQRPDTSMAYAKHGPISLASRYTTA